MTPAMTFLLVSNICLFNNVLIRWQNSTFCNVSFFCFSFSVNVIHLALPKELVLRASRGCVGTRGSEEPV